MPKLILTSFVIAGLLFLPSCSKSEPFRHTAESKKCLNANIAHRDSGVRIEENLRSLEKARKTTYSENIEEDKSWSEYFKDKFETFIKKEELLRARIIVKNPNCFTDKELDNAQFWLTQYEDKVLKLEIIEP